MKTAIIAILPALLLCGTAQAQLGGVTGTARDTVNQASDPALTGQFDRTTSRLNGPSSRIDSIRARQAERAARRAAAALPPAPSIEPQVQAITEGQAELPPELASAALATRDSAEAAATTVTSLPSETGVDTVVRQQLADIPTLTSETVQLAPPPVAAPRVAVSSPGPAPVIQTGGSGGVYQTSYRETVVERRVAADPAPRAPAASGNIRIDGQSLAPAQHNTSSGQRSGFSIWPILIAGLLITLLLGLARRSNRRRQTA